MWTLVWTLVWTTVSLPWERNRVLNERGSGINPGTEGTSGRSSADSRCDDVMGRAIYLSIYRYKVGARRRCKAEECPLTLCSRPPPEFKIFDAVERQRPCLCQRNFFSPQACIPCIPCIPCVPCIPSPASELTSWNRRVVERDQRKRGDLLVDSSDASPNAPPVADLSDHARGSAPSTGIDPTVSYLRE